MVTQLPSAGEPQRIQYLNKWHELIITVRDNGDIASDVLGELVTKTVGTWLRAYAAVKLDKWSVGDAESAEQALGVTIETPEPFVTIWNKDFNGLTLTVHSNENGQGAVDAYAAFQAGIDAVRDAMPQLFGDVQDTQATPDNVRPLPQQPTGEPSTKGLPTTGSPFIRSTKQGIADGFIAIESGKTDQPTFTKQAMIADKPYHWKDKQYKDAVDFVAYPITGAISVKEFDGQLSLAIPTEHNKTIYIKNRGTDNDYDWKGVRDKLALDEEKLEAGQSAMIPASYIVLKLNSSEDAQYKNFYGFFNAPEPAQAKEVS